MKQGFSKDDRLFVFRQIDNERSMVHGGKEFFQHIARFHAQTGCVHTGMAAQQLAGEHVPVDKQLYEIGRAHV